MQKTIIVVLSTLLVVSLIWGATVSYRLGQNRQRLEQVRVELSAAQNRQYELAEILKRDGAILRESSTTIAGIRSQIRVIRESYEEMENIIYSGICNSSERRDSNVLTPTK